MGTSKSVQEVTSSIIQSYYTGVNRYEMGQMGQMSQKGKMGQGGVEGEGGDERGEGVEGGEL